MSDRLSLLTDPSLTDTAVRVALLLLELGEGEWHPLAFDDLSRVLHGYPGPDGIRRHLRILTAAGWLERRPGGRGNPDQFRIASVKRPTLRDRLAGKAQEAEPDRVGQTTQVKTDRVGQTTKSKGPSKEGEREVGSSPSISPPELEDSAAELFEAHRSTLNGCGDSLRDYVRTRVAPDRHRAFVGTVLSWLDGLDPNAFRKDDGTSVPQEERTKLLAVALNELGATDEDGTRAHPAGDPRNLRNKLRGIINGPSRPRRSKHGSDPVSPTSSPSPSSELGLGDNLGSFEIE